MDQFPSLKTKRLLSILKAQPLGYRVARQKGSHRRMESDRYPSLTFAFHDGATIPGGMVRRILVDQVGLDESTARGLV